jgi:lipopolysaccharide export LptBFGC system permease protein LptF
VGLFLVIDFFMRIDHLLEAREIIRENGRSVAVTVVSYYLYNIPFIFIQIAPFITLMGAIFAMTRLMKNNELVPMLNAGASLVRVAVPIFVMGFVFTGLMILVQEKMIPKLVWERHALDRLVDGEEPEVIDDIGTLTDRKGSRVRIGSFDFVKQRIHDLDVTRFQPEQGELNAETATYRSGDRGRGWYLERGVARAFDNPTEPIPLVDYWETDITPQDILLAVDDKSAFSFRQLQRAYEKDPGKIGLLSLMHSKFTYPLSNLILLLLGLSAILSQRTRSRFLGIAMCFLICGAFFATDFVARTLGDRGTLHPIVAAWIPVTLFGSLGITMFGAVRT